MKLIVFSSVGVAISASTGRPRTTVTLTGTGFLGATGVTFDGAPGTNFTVVNDTEITVTTPAGTPGTADVVVEHPVENSTPGAFTYLAVPAISEVAPTSGPETGGTTVTLTGTGFLGATGVTFAGIAGTNFTVVSDTEITVTTPAGTIGIADVIIGHPVENSAPGAFTYLAVPVISDITPDTGPETGGTEVTITGTGFGLCTNVTFDGVPGINVRVIDANTIVVTTPAGSVGTADVVVICPSGSSNVGQFAYTAVATSSAPPLAHTGGSELPIGIAPVLLLAGTAILTMRRVLGNRQA